MARLGPFEERPRLAVGVSGGADSLALALLAHDWAARQGGAVTALVVDHGLRAESGREARQVGRWLAARRIAHRRLRWEDAKADRNIQAAARAARYALMSAWCRRNGVLHLALAHHREDQAETLLLRLARGSGVDGLAAIAAVNELPGLRLIRPLLDMPRARLAATLAERDQPWIEDPSNRDRAYARVRMRALLPRLADEGATAERLAATAHRLARARATLEGATTALLAQAARIDPAGYCLLDREALRKAPDEIALRALGASLATVSGAVYRPRLDSLERLLAVLADGTIGGGRTLGGCRIVPRRGGLLICREAADIADDRPVTAGAPVLWDGRFLIRAASRSGRRLRLARLGQDGWRELTEAWPEARKTALPAPVRATLPTLRRNGRLIAVPHMGYGREWLAELRFQPRRPLAGNVFFVANSVPQPIS